MTFCKLILCFLILSNTIVVPSLSNKEEEILFTGLNTYRSSLNLPALVKNPHAKCISKQISNERDNIPCPVILGSLIPGPDFVSQLAKQYRNNCKLDFNTTKEAVVVNVCVQDLVPSLVLGNFTSNMLYQIYLNDSKYKGFGAASQDDWMVVTLSTDTHDGALLTNGGFRVLPIQDGFLGKCMVFLLMLGIACCYV